MLPSTFVLASALLVYFPPASSLLAIHSGPSLPGCISQGESKAEALRNIKEAVELYLESESSQVKQSKSRQIVEVTV